METAEFLVGNPQEGVGMIAPVKAFFVTLMVGLASILPGWGEENSAQRLENAQQGMAEGSWPRKPDNRLSPLSGKTKDNREISLRYYGKEKEFRGKSAEGWLQETSFGQKPNWEGASGRNWEGLRWGQDRDWAAGKGESEKFQMQAELGSEQTVTMREMGRETAQGWASRAARLGGGRDGALRMYEGRLTRVRQQVGPGEPSPRDLGPGRQEKFTPREVDEMLSRPVGEPRANVREQSPEASPLAAADN